MHSATICFIGSSFPPISGGLNASAMRTSVLLTPVHAADLPVA